MSSTQRSIEAAIGKRVYEYVGSDGTIYYSFTKHPATLSSPTRLRLKSRIGTHLVNFLTALRHVGALLGVEDEEDGG